ncbi:MAG: hypothetical protein LPJ89_03305 [Hymenobacteraceae bacterium]|nr:hypothetical protein [Hymenobacteraceae bacterium]MDX5396975.1 hypothetical protein [Hymenobacteraceae bacterium]MDX5442790.1 hypothetical protein [Hymenobacteraceae bacterium]MDX5513049.1 hypothetical protein [Hymenobacteraceae bacterium]
MLGWQLYWINIEFQNNNYFVSDGFVAPHLLYILYYYPLTLILNKMEYDVLIAGDLESLSLAVNERLRSGWRLKDYVMEHVNGFAQEVVRHPAECVAQKQKERKRRKMRWIDLD